MVGTAIDAPGGNHVKNRQRLHKSQLPAGPTESAKHSRFALGNADFNQNISRSKGPARGPSEDRGAGRRGGKKTRIRLLFVMAGNPKTTPSGGLVLT